MIDNNDNAASFVINFTFLLLLLQLKLLLLLLIIIPTRIAFTTISTIVTVLLLCSKGHLPNMSVRDKVRKGMRTSNEEMRQREDGKAEGKGEREGRRKVEGRAGETDNG